MLNVNQTTSAHDLAKALDGDQGSFIARQGNQIFLVVAAQGHSIKSGPTPIGPAVSGLVQSQSIAGDPWFITKISEKDLSAEQQYQQSQQQR